MKGLAVELGPDIGGTFLTWPWDARGRASIAVVAG